MPGLDGLRAIAVLAVIAYHEQFGWAPGGLLGVALFFTLSGYLITDLLLAQWVTAGGIRLKQFWLRRARRLLPALFVMLAAVTAWVTIADRVRLASLRGPVLAAVTYTSNWYLIAKNQSYFARFAPPQPLDHLWSLAVEEQFYLLWPWLLLLALLVLRRAGGKSVKWLAVPTLLLAAGSAVLMARLYQPGLDPTRIYEGTDTRACGLLVGAALAMIWPSRSGASMKRRLWLLDVAAGAGLVVVGFMIADVGEYSAFLYRGGLAVLALATAAILAAGAVPGSIVGRVLAWSPLRWLGVRSYGIYLWHYPVIVLSSPANSTEDLPRAAVQVAASIALAALSWKFIEEPVRHGAIGKQLDLVRSGGWRGYVRSRAMIGTTSMTAVVALACVGLAGVIPISEPARASGPVQQTAASGPAQTSVHPRAGAVPVITGLTPIAEPSTTAAPKLLTSCTSVVHVGDSTSEGMIMSDYIPDAAQRLPAQYHDVGVKHVITEISGARSIVEVLPGQVNGYNVAKSLVSSGYQGCWVIALGTNDTANVAIGSNVSRAARIAEMMSVTRGQPVMWVNVRSLLAGGPYAESNMELWDKALLHACARYPNMRIYDWASIVRTSWYISDGIHFTSQGYIARGHDIARALARAFPLHGPSTGCVVG